MNHNIPSLINSQENLSGSLDAQTYAPEDLQGQVEYLQQQVNNLTSKLSELTEQQTGNSTNRNPEQLTNSSISNRDNIINSGIDSYNADEILLRLDQQNDRSLELHKLIQNSSSTERGEYGKELLELNKNKISLRSEMGDDAFDQYLFLNNENNRVKVTSVMSGSPAESAGLQLDDIIISYDYQKIITLTDIQSTSSKGETGNNTIMQIIRDGEEISLTVPRGTLGAYLDPVLVDPNLGH